MATTKNCLLDKYFIKILEMSREEMTPENLQYFEESSIRASVAVTQAKAILDRLDSVLLRNPGDYRAEALMKALACEIYDVLYFAGKAQAVEEIKILKDLDF